MKDWKLQGVVLDCPEPRELADWYHRVTGWPYFPGHESADPSGDDWLLLVPPGGTMVAFQRSDAPVPPWRSGARVHLDLAVADLEEAHGHLIECGAVSLTGPPEEEGHPDDPFRVYADPAGHPFCTVTVGTVQPST